MSESEETTLAGSACASPRRLSVHGEPRWPAVGLSVPDAKCRGDGYNREGQIFRTWGIIHVPNPCGLGK